MQDHTRRAVAFIAGAIGSGRKVSSVYDFSTNSYYNMSITITDSKIAAFDHTQGCHIDGPISGRKISLYHYGNGKYLDLESKGSNFSGYDYDSGKHFDIKLNGSTLSIYDYENSSYFNYSI